MTMTTRYVLGASDPEMTEIETILRAAGAEYTHAMAGGQRCHPGSAYNADPVWVGGSTRTLVLVECAPRALHDQEYGGDPWTGEVVIIDHHRPGDPGYGRGPADCWEASSLGQVCAVLGVDPTPELQLSAAADHCLAAAYAGQCPGVDPVELAAHRAEQRGRWLASRTPGDVAADAVWRHCCHTPSKFSSEDENLAAEAADWTEAVRGQIRETQARVRHAPKVRLGTTVVRDLRGSSYPELPEALAQMGECGVYRLETPRGVKIGILGAGEGTVPGRGPVEAFMGAARGGAVLGVDVDPSSVYGDPARGFAGVMAPIPAGTGALTGADLDLAVEVKELIRRGE